MRPATLPVLAISLAIGLAARSAIADDVDALVTEGDALARAGQFAEALDRFKRADRITPKARHACMVGLAYLRLQMLPRAEVFLTRCRVRATPADPLPEWMDDAEHQLRDQIAAATMAEVDVRVLPVGAAATVTVSSFGTDEAFEPQVIHLPVGVHVIEARAPGYTTVARRLEITAAGKLPVEITLEPVAVVTAPQPKTVQTLPVVPANTIVTTVDHTWSNRLLVGAGVAAAGGIVLHVLASRSRTRLDDAATVAEYRDHETAFDLERAGTFSLYGIAAIAGGFGLYLRLTARESPVQVSGDLRGDAAFVTIGWQR